MEGSKRIAEHLVATGAYTDLENPVILTDGQLGIYYVNAEKLLEDGGAWKAECEKGSRFAINHALRSTENSRIFNEVIEILTKRMSCLIPVEGDRRVAISGGERRDWLFSGPVADILGYPHISLYKDGMRVERISSSRAIFRVVDELDLEKYSIIHVADLLTEGSSAYKSDGISEKGWIPMLRHRGAHISDLIAVVSRKQGGEERLGEQKVNAHSLVAIDEEFLRAHSTDPERAVTYVNDPTAWSVAYLQENGALAIIDAFDPKKTSKDERSFKFLRRYEKTLREGGKWEELEMAVGERYHFDLNSALDCGAGT